MKRKNNQARRGPAAPTNPQTLSNRSGAAAEILAEKVRAILTRAKGRDLFDLWCLLNQKAALGQRQKLPEL